MTQMGRTKMGGGGKPRGCAGRDVEGGEEIGLTVIVRGEWGCG